jgi:hypothetical protein
MRNVIVSLCDYSGEWSRPVVEQGDLVIRVDPMHEPGIQATAGVAREGSGDSWRMPDGGHGLAMTAGQFARQLQTWSPVGVCNLATVLAGFVGADFDTFRMRGVLAAPPCTHYSGSGARWWPLKDADGRTEEANAIVRDCLRVVGLLRPRWWVLENPAGRIERCVPELKRAPIKWTFHPCDFAGLADDPASEAYTKRTVLWGRYTPPLNTARVEPVMIEKRRKDGSVVRGSWMWANLGGKSERTKALRSKTPQGFARAFAAIQE